MQYKRFNRYEVFNDNDRSLVLDIIKHVEPFGSEANMLYGLFDGYWYNDLESSLMAKNDIPTYLLADLTSLLDQVQGYITLNGETIQEIY